MNWKTRLRRADSPALVQWAWPWGPAILGAVLIGAAVQVLGAGAVQADAGTTDRPQTPGLPRWTQAARLGLWGLPLLPLIAAAVSCRRARRREQALQHRAAVPSPDSMLEMDWPEFEALMREAFRLRGYEAGELAPERPAPSRDLVLWRDGEKLLIRCKPWKTYRVGPEHVRESTELMRAVGAGAAYLVSSGYFTEPAQRLAAQQRIVLLDGPALRRLLAEARASRLLKPSQAAMTPRTPLTEPGCGIRAALQALALAQQAPRPNCPRCGGAMQHPTAPAGALSWGCSASPDDCGGRGNSAALGS